MRKKVVIKIEYEKESCYKICNKIVVQISFLKLKTWIQNISKGNHR